MDVNAILYRVMSSVTRAVAVLSFACAWGAVSPSASWGSNPASWARVEFLEDNTVRCQVDDTPAGGARWRVFYGEVQSSSTDGWEAVRSRAGCEKVEGESDGGPWTLRGSPYLIVDVVPVTLMPTTSKRAARLELSLAIRKCTGFSKQGNPQYDRNVEKRILWVPEGESVSIPLLMADARESAEFGVRELHLRVSAALPRSSAPTEYGEIALSADEPRAGVFLDGGLVGRTPVEQPHVLSMVRTGEREIVVRDAAGREARTVVNVAKNARTDVSLHILPSTKHAAAPGLRPLGRNPQGRDEFWREKDDAIVVQIPAGEFAMGTDSPAAEPASQPRHTVRVRGFLLDKMEVTWGQYRRFLEGSGRTPPKAPIWGMQDDIPASNVTWDDAHAFCAWVGGRLPSEAEWERAARGDDDRIYPWGNSWDPSRCNTRDGGPHAPWRPGAFPDCISPYGVLDLAGSVWEWCEDRFDPGYYASSPVENPTGPEDATTKLRATRGGNWMSAAEFVRTTHRQGADPTWVDPMHGFRCAHDDVGQLADADRPTPARSTAEPPSPTGLTGIEMKIAPVRAVGPIEPCSITLSMREGAKKSWSMFGEVARNAESKAAELVAASIRCGIGDPPTPTTSTASAAPLLVVQTAVTPGWDDASMAPGPVPTAQIALDVTIRTLSGFSSDDAPVFQNMPTERRMFRLSVGDEFTGFLPAAGLARELAGVQEIPIRVRADAPMPSGITEYGALVVTTAAPGSDVLVDGGIAGHAASDGTAHFASVPSGAREVRFRALSGRDVVRNVTIVKGRTVLVSDDAPDGGRENARMKPIGRNPQGFPELERPRDRAVMVQIPEGEFVMGNLETEGAPEPHTVSVSSFLMDKFPVTVGRYKRFAAATGRPLPPEPYWGFHDDHPVAFVRWDEALAYCEWAHVRLPTEAEREKATRGTDGRKFPWGNEDPSEERAVFRRNWGYEGTQSVGLDIRRAGVSPYGLYDTGGHMWEWCSDWYDPRYYKESPRLNPTGPKTGRARIVRGGSWDSRPTVLSASSRNWGYVGYREGDFGFRCAADVPR